MFCVGFECTSLSCKILLFLITAFLLLDALTTRLLRFVIYSAHHHQDAAHLKERMFIFVDGALHYQACLQVHSRVCICVNFLVSICEGTISCWTVAGNLWVALGESGCVVQYDPSTGEELQVRTSQSGV